MLLDERIVSAPSIQSEINNRGQITGKFDRKKVDRDVQILRSGALSAELVEKPVSENTIGPTLGEDTIKRGQTAVVHGLRRHPRVHGRLLPALPALSRASPCSPTCCSPSASWWR